MVKTKTVLKDLPLAFMIIGLILIVLGLSILIGEQSWGPLPYWLYIYGYPAIPLAIGIICLIVGLLSHFGLKEGHIV